ncbi:VOC family protein [Micromonospora sp. NBC_01796]|uniref:VOC family protein n=1 Tax=Micromonospora sp. NBC_01796 TaxID=2975987 RepID=UPI002DDA98A8|nr:VOC family protein [Micromonospora sp. NBC_01796]WSA84432.1 VOC family protein [Micromonospora sp. NBC_01796]
MTRKTFVNLPVKDLRRTVEFFGALGFTFDPTSSDGNSTRMIVSDDVSVLLQVAPSFEGFTGRAVTDTATSAEVIIGLSAESRDEVDDLADRVLAAGGQVLGEPVDQGFMYMRGFLDPDGHQWSFLYLDAAPIGAPQP